MHDCKISAIQSEKEENKIDPITILNAAVAGVDGLLSIINAIRGQNGVSDDAILAAAQAETVTNQAQIAALLAALPPKS